MKFVWHEDKDRRNIAKHKVSFETAPLDDPRAISQLDRVVEGEERWQTLGLASGIVVLLVAHTYREHGGEEIARVISARKATATERARYDQTI